MSINTRLEDFQQKIWSAAEVLRGSISAHEYPEYILPLVFLKYITDLYQRAEDQKWRDSNEERRLWLVDKLEHIFSGNRRAFNNYYSLCENVHDDELGKRINQTLANVEAACPKELQEVFSVIDFDSYRLGKPGERSVLLKNLLNSIRKISFDQAPSESYLYHSGDFFSLAVESLSSNRKNDTWIAPFELAHLIAKLLAPEEWERIYDPACGTGSLLVTCGSERKFSFKNSCRIFGIERSVLAWSFSRMNAFLHGESGYNIVHGGFEFNVHSEENLKCEVAVSFPPWGAKESPFPELPYDIRDHFLPNLGSKLSTEYIAALHMLSSLNRQSGRLALVVPSGALSKGGAERFVRQRLVEENYIDAVIELPEKVIAGTSVSFSIIILRTNRNTNDVLFVDATNPLYLNRGQVRISTEQINELIEIYRNFQNSYKVRHVDSIKYASPSTIIENNFNLNVGNFVRHVKISQNIDISTVRVRQANLKRELEELDSEVNKILREKDFSYEN